jgi:DNA/RNA endonuclease G (NUC1)
MVDVFISYTRADQAVAAQLHDFLTTEGWEVWYDPEIYAGARWEDLLMDTLRDAKAVVVLWSPRSVERKWVLKEAGIALEQGKLVPVMIEQCALPRQFAAIEAAQLMNWKGGSHPELAAFASGLTRLAPPSRVDTVRPGFDTGFLDVEVGLPSITGVGEEFKYLHFSVVMNPARRLAWYVAYNMQPPEGARPTRKDMWMADPMLPRAFQPGNEHFRGTGYDRGHIARVAAVTWGTGRDMHISSRQAFFWTNTSPQHPWINRNWWLELDEWEASIVKTYGRAVGFSGPVLRPDDPIHDYIEQTVGRLVAKRTFRLPQAFWKVVVAPSKPGRFQVAGFVIEEREVKRLGPGAARQAVEYRVPLADIEKLVGIEFSKAVHGFGSLPVRSRAQAARVARKGSAARL